MKEKTHIQLSEDTIKNSKFIECDCGGTMFTEKMMFKNISKILSPTGKDEIFPMNVIICERCKKVPSQFNPGDIIPK